MVKLLEWQLLKSSVRMWSDMYIDCHGDSLYENKFTRHVYSQQKY